jgi:hypothetical protein
MAFPIVVDFTEDSGTIKKNGANQHDNDSRYTRKNGASKPKRNAVNFSHLSHFYNQLVMALEAKSNFSDDISVEAIEIDARDIHDESVSELSETVFKEFPLVEELIRQSSNYNSSSSLSSAIGNRVSSSDQSGEKYSAQNTYNRDQSSLNLTLDSSDTLGSLLLSDTKDIPKRQTSTENSSVLTMLKNVLSYLMSPVPLLILSLVLVFFVLSSGRD